MKFSTVQGTGKILSGFLVMMLVGLGCLPLLAQDADLLGGAGPEVNQHAFLSSEYEPDREPRPLSEWLQRLAGRHGIPLVIESGVHHNKLELPVQWETSGRRVERVLRDVLSQHELRHYWDDGVLAITNDDDRQLLEIFDLSELAESQEEMEEIRELILEFVDSLSWEENGGPSGARMRVFRQKLIVRNTAAVHQELQDFLERLK